MVSGPGKSEERLRREAADWLARSRGPDHDPAALERWCAADPAHREAYERLLVRWEQAGQLAFTRTGRARSLGRSEARSTRHRMLALAAALAGLVAAAIILLSARPAAPVDGPAPAMVADIATEAGAARTIELADGSRVTLSADTSLQVHVDGAGRRVALRLGRARFFVKPDKTRPFTVEAGGRMVTAVGTVFDVAMIRGGAVSVTVLEGAVDVATAGPSASKVAGRRLRAGEALSLAGVDEAVRPGPAGASARLDFDDVTLGEAVAVANRQGGARILILDPSVAALRLTGSYPAGDAGGLSRAIARAFGLDVEETPAGDYILRARGG